MVPERGGILILHGLDGSGPGHWQRWLAGRLGERGEPVAFPDLPGAADPDPEAWDRALGAELAARPETVICHSLACLLWLRAAARAPGRIAGRVLLVAPPWRDDLAPVARFLGHGADRGAVARAAGSTLIVCSDDDPYCPGGAIDRFAGPLGLPAVLAGGAGHLNTDAGYGPWPPVERWALGDDRAFGAHRA